MLRFTLATSLLLLTTVSLLPAQGTKFWNQAHYEEFEKGQGTGVAIASDGHLEPGPSISSLADLPATYVWSVAVDKSGAVYAATGSPATVVRIAPDGKATKLFESKDLNVQAVRVGPDGDIYAATLPTGKVYRIPPSAAGISADKAEVVFDPATAPASGAAAAAAAAKTTEGGTGEHGPQYIWDMAFDARGRLYIATGGPAAIYRVTPGQNHTPELFYASDEQHIRCLLFGHDGALYAGSDGDGLIYSFTPGTDGPAHKPRVLFNAPKREITALAEAPGGALYAAAVGEPGKSPLPPLPVSGAQSITATITIVTPGSVQASNTNTILPEGSDVFELTPGGAPRRLWSAHDDVIYSLRWTPEGLLAGTGNRGRVYRVGENGEFADLAHLASGQVTSVAAAPDETLIMGTSNSGKVYRLGAPAPQSTFYSDAFDAGVYARWGRAEVDAGFPGGGTEGVKAGGTAPASGYTLYARSGNVANPERGWSPWSQVNGNAATVGVPPGRYAQWKLVLAPGAHINAVGLNYLPVNIAPVVDEVVVQTGARVNQQAMIQPAQVATTINLPSASANVVNIVQDAQTGPLQAIKDKGAITVRWAAHDENGDDLIFAVFYRGDGTTEWQLLKDNLSERFLSFDAALLPDGPYRLKIVASDALSHNPGEALTSARESDRFVVDTSTPVVHTLSARLENGKLHVTAEATDPASPVTHAEFSVDASPWQYIEPVGQLSDARTEHYDFLALLPRTADATANAGGEHIITLRVYDRYENSGAAKAVVR